MEKRCDVFGQVRGQLITKPARVNRVRVADLLATSVLGAGESDSSTSAGVTQDVLDFEVAASGAELKELLDKGPYVNVDGVWKRLTASLESSILDTTVNLIAANGWDPEDLVGEALLKEVQQHLGASSVPSLPALRKALRSIEADSAAELAAAKAADSAAAAEAAEAAASPGKGKAPESAVTPTKADTKTSSATPAASPAAKAPVAEGHFSLDKKKIDVFRASQLLKMPPAQVRERFQLPAPQPKAKRARHGPGGASGARVDAALGPNLTVDEFATALQELTVASEKPSPEEVWKLLGHNAYLDEFEGTLHALDVTTLSQDPRARLKKLFELQSHWNPGRLSSLIAPSLGAGVKVDVWVMKNARQVFCEIEQGKEERLLTKKFNM